MRRNCSRRGSITRRWLMWWERQFTRAPQMAWGSRISRLHLPAVRGDREGVCAVLVAERSPWRCEWSQLRRNRKVLRGTFGLGPRCTRGFWRRGRSSQWSDVALRPPALLGITRELAQWSDVVRDHRDVRDVPIESDDATGDAGDRVAQRSKGARVSTSSLMSIREAVKKFLPVFRRECRCGDCAIRYL